MSKPDPIEVHHHEEATQIAFSAGQIDYMLIDRAKRISTSTANLAFQKAVILDLTSVDAVSSMVLGALVDLFRQCKSAGQRMFLVGLSPAVFTAFKSTGLDRFFEIRNDVDTVVDFLARPGR